MKSVVVTLVVLLACALCGFKEGRAQAVEIDDPGCRQLKENTPLFSIAYERAEQKRGKTKDIVLRLRNNSTCDAAFLANIDHSIRLAKQLNGGMKIERISDLQENVPNNLVFRIVRWKDKKHISLINNNNCVVFTRRLASGKSTLFTVPGGHFNNRSNIGLTFEYLWKNQVDRKYGKYNLFSQEIKLPNGSWKVTPAPKLTFMLAPSPVTIHTQ